VDVLLSVSIAGWKSVSWWRSWADGSRVKDSVQGGDVCVYACPASKLMISERSAPELSPVGTGSVPGRGGVGSGVGCLHRSGGGAPVPLGLQRVWGFFAVPFWQEWHPAMWFWWSIARCLSSPAFTCLCPGISISLYVSSRISAQVVLIRYCVCSIAVCENTSLAILTIFKARRMSDCSSCTRPASLAIVADMLNTYKKLVAAFNNGIQRVPLPYTLP